ncbi:MAG: HD domain-containing protein [Chloroflexi bacterium]|nr:HD domain-containing protein [Chloroflexota bacterium]
MKTAQPSALNLLALSPRQRRIISYLMREGSMDRDDLAQAVAGEQTEVQAVLAELQAMGHIHLSAHGRVELALGKTRRRRLPARLWPALFTTGRLYSSQEIMTLRTVVPILQFARARLGEYTDHGPGHVLRVKSFATQLGYVLGLTNTEQHLLRTAALFHDVGNVVERARHHMISQETVEKLAATGQIPFSMNEAALIGLLCRWHRKEYEPARADTLHGEQIRTGLLASILRVADALDSDYRRFDYTDKFIDVINFFFPHEMIFWTGLGEISGIRIYCTPQLGQEFQVTLQLFLQAEAQATTNLHIQALHKDVNETPLEWSVQIIPVVATGQATAPPHSERAPTALLVCPFEPHSLVMTALSRNQLLAAGYTVELLIYPDTHEATAWLWQEALSDYDPTLFARLIVIGDRPDPAITPQLSTMLVRWQATGVHVSLLNRHEANWARLPTLLQHGVSAILGGDWAYFWGDAANGHDLAWGRIAALCTRDPTQSTVGLTPEEESVTQGLLNVVYGAQRQAAEDLAGWLALATPILDRIAANDRAYFAAQATDFVVAYTAFAVPGRIEGNVIHFELDVAEFTAAYYWALESAIEQQGRTMQRGICFNRPYALVAWPSGDMVELLAINHWREEEATPIRLLYPIDLGPPPEGNENALRVRLPVTQATTVIRGLIDACNQSQE